MKLIATSLLLVFILDHPASLANKSVFEIPKKIVSALDSKYPGWYLVDNLRIMSLLQGNGIDTTKCRPNFVWGDFDGNGEQDYVAFIERKVGANPKEQFLVAFLATGSEFNHYLLDEAKGDAYITEFIWLAEKGSKSYDFEKDKEFLLEEDSVELIVYGKGSNLIYYNKGKFKRITTGD